MIAFRVKYILIFIYFFKESDGKAFCQSSIQPPIPGCNEKNRFKAQQTFWPGSQFKCFTG